ncbi:MAG: Spy/CpxP family protein refolding chaperone [Candidatus Marinimicrobia bacterium]|nr:Spy/CpxP family protein refolding chaperone [Candidatus Neomarinimicrobiota bacterium]
MKKYLTILLAVVVIPGLLFSGPQKMMKKEVKSMHSPDLEIQLKLTDAQKDQMHKLKVENQKKNIPLVAKLKLARIELEEIIQSDASQKKIDEAVKKVNGIRSKLFSQRIKHRIDMAKVLTKEQKSILKDCKFRHHFKRFGKSLKRHGGHGMFGQEFLPEFEFEEDIDMVIIDD